MFQTPDNGRSVIGLFARERLHSASGGTRYGIITIEPFDLPRTDAPLELNEKEILLNGKLSRLVLVATLLLVPALFLVGTRRPVPAPTEHLLDEDAEERNKDGRKEWIESMHRTAPGVDWRSVERENGRRLQERRNREVGQSKTAASQWIELGSRNLAGRMHCVALSPSADSLYAGSSRGGVWKGDLNGLGWRPLSDNLFGGSHGLAVADYPVETVTSITDNGLIHYTTDGGATWLRPTGIYPEATEGKRIVRDLAAPGRVYLLLRNGTTSAKVYRSDDGGATYTRIMRLGPEISDMWIDRVTGGDLFVQKGLQTFRTTDQGASWDTLGVIPASGAAGMVLTGSEAGSPTLYAAVDVGSTWELYRSVDAGSTWMFRYTITDFWETLDASITDANTVLFGGVECWRSIDGGATFAKVNGWGEYYGDPLHKLHADLPGMNTVWTAGGEILYIATDGGLFRSDDRGGTVTNISLSALGVSQYYSTLTSAADPARVAAGAQDQGFQVTNGTSGGTLLDFDQLISGDYGHLTSGDGTHGTVYSVYPDFILVTKGETDHHYVTQIDFPPGETYPYAPWLPFIRGTYESNDVFYFCGTHLYRYRRTYGANWTYDQLPQSFSGGTGAFLTAFTISPADNMKRYAVTNNGAPWYTADAGSTWTKSTGTAPDYQYLYGTAIAPSPLDPDVVYIGGSGYSNPGVVKSTDGGVTWSDASDSLPATMVYDLAFEGTGTGALYAATDAGPYRRDPADGVWSYIGNAAAPLTTYWSVEAVNAAGVIRFGTYGRGIWDYDYAVATGVASAGGGEPVIAAPRLMNFPNPFNPSTKVRYRLDEETRFSLVVYDASGRKVRTLASGRANAGDYETTWDGRSDGGNDVASGVYLALLETDAGASTRRMTLIR